MEMGRFAGAAAAALLGIALTGAAQGGEGPSKGVYVGVSAGHGLFKFRSDEVDDCARSGVCRADDEEIAYSVYGGFEFSPHVAVEVGVVGHEALEIEYDPGSCRDGSALRNEFSAWSVYAAAIGRPPIDFGRIRPFGKAGLYWWRSEDEWTCGSGAFASTQDDDDAAPLLGAGADVELTGRTSLRAEWVWFTEDKGVHAFLGGLNVRF